MFALRAVTRYITYPFKQNFNQHTTTDRQALFPKDWLFNQPKAISITTMNVIDDR